MRKIMFVFLHLKHNLEGVKKCNKHKNKPDCFHPYKEIDESN